MPNYRFWDFLLHLLLSFGNIVDFSDSVARSVPRPRMPKSRSTFLIAWQLLFSLQISIVRFSDCVSRIAFLGLRSSDCESVGKGQYCPKKGFQEVPGQFQDNRISIPGQSWLVLSPGKEDASSACAIRKCHSQVPFAASASLLSVLFFREFHK